MPVPKIIWLLWLQGWASAPEIVRACAASWRRLNPGWNVCYLEARDIARLFPPPSRTSALIRGGLSPAAISDLARLELLARHGGVWADATTYALAPLDDWLPDAAAGGFFAFDQPGPHRPIATWFLAATLGSPIVQAWWAKTDAYWRERTEPDAYFWPDYLFSELRQSNPAIARLWDATPKRAADGPRALAPYEAALLGPLTGRVRGLVENADQPMLKLTHKIDHQRGVAGTVYRWLCERQPADGGFGLPPDWRGWL